MNREKQRKLVGLSGEMITTWTCLLDFICASLEDQNLMYTVDMFEKYLSELLISDEAFTINLVRAPEELAGEEPNPEKFEKLQERWPT